MKAGDKVKSHPVTEVVGAVGGGITQVEIMQQRVEKFYDWAKEDWYFKWVGRYVMVMILYALYCLKKGHLELAALNHLAAYQVAMEHEFTTAEKTSKKNREKVVALLTSFNQRYPKPTPKQLEDLKVELGAIMFPRKISASKAWEEICEKTRQRNLLELEAYIKSNNLESFKKSTSQIVRERADGTVNKDVLQETVKAYALVDPELPAEVAERLRIIEQRNAETQETIDWLADLANSVKK